MSVLIDHDSTEVPEAGFRVAPDHFEIRDEATDQVKLTVYLPKAQMRELGEALVAQVGAAEPTVVIRHAESLWGHVVKTVGAWLDDATVTPTEEQVEALADAVARHVEETSLVTMKHERKTAFEWGREYERTKQLETSNEVPA